MDNIFDLQHAVDVVARAHWPFSLAVDIRHVGCAVVGFAYGPEYIKTQSVGIDKLEVPNDSDSVLTQRIAGSKTTSAVLSWTVRKGVSSTSTLGLTVPLPGGIQVSGSKSQTLSLERTDSQTLTTTQTWNWDISIPIQPRSTISVQVLVDEIQLKVDFTATANFHGEVVLVQVRTASPMPDVIMTTIGIGKLFSQAADSPVKVLDDHTIAVPIEGTLTNREGNAYRMPVTQSSLRGLYDPTSYTAQSGARTTFGAVSLVRTDYFSPGTHLPGAGQLMMVAGDTIGTPDGIHYRVVSNREVVKPTPACGYNDAMAPIPGSFKVETRFYEEFRDGSLIRSWTEDVETFDRCLSV